MTDLDLVRAELELADRPARERLALEIHHLRALRQLVIARGRRADALIYHRARVAPEPLELDPPAEPGSSADLIRSAA